MLPLYRACWSSDCFRGRPGQVGIPSCVEKQCGAAPAISQVAPADRSLAGRDQALSGDRFVRAPRTVGARRRSVGAIRLAHRRLPLARLRVAKHGSAAGSIVFCAAVRLSLALCNGMFLLRCASAQCHCFLCDGPRLVAPQNASIRRMRTSVAILAQGSCRLVQLALGFPFWCCSQHRLLL